MKQLLGIVGVEYGFFLYQFARKKQSAQGAERVCYPNQKQVETNDPQRLSDHGFFKGDLAALLPTARVYPTINTPLFSNYAEKARFIYLPKKEMDLPQQGPLRFEEGTVLIKTFITPLMKNRSL